MQPDEMIRMIKDASGAFELYHVMTFRGYREDKNDGSTDQVTVEVWDAGPSRPDNRYSVKARDSRGREASGNPDGRLDVALAIVHWYDLDK